MNANDSEKSRGRVVLRSAVNLRDIAAPKQIEKIERRLFLKQGLSLGALALLSGCDVSDNEAVDKVLWTMSRWNDRVQAALFNPDRLVQEYPASAITRPFPFNAYYDEDEIRVVDGSSYKLELAGMIRDRQAWTLPALHALPQVTQITRHICVEGWSAIGQWSGVPFRTFLERIGADTTARYVALQVRRRLSHQHRHGDSPATADAAHATLWWRYPAGEVRFPDEIARADQARLQESQAHHGHRGDQHLSRRLLGRPGLQLVQWVVSAGLMRRPEK